MERYRGRGVALVRFFSIGFFFLFSLVLQFNLWPRNVCCPNASDVFGARFKLLSAGAGSKHGDLCNEQISDSNERFNLNRGGSITLEEEEMSSTISCNALAGITSSNSQDTRTYQEEKCNSVD